MTTAQRLHGGFTPPIAGRAPATSRRGGRRPPGTPGIGTPGIGALVLDRVARAQVVDALHGPAAGYGPFAGLPVAFFDTVRVLAAAIETGTPFAALVIEPRDREHVATEAMVRTVRRGFPSVPVIALAGLHQGTADDVLALARAGVHGLVLRGIDDTGARLRHAFECATRRSFGDRALADLGDVFAPSLHPILRCCLDRADAAGTVHDVACTLGVHRKTLVNRLQASAMPAPHALLAWTRLLRAGELLEDPRRSVEHVAMTLGYPSANALRNGLRRYTGLDPTTVRELGGYACVLLAFRRALRPGARAPGARA